MLLKDAFLYILKSTCSSMNCPQTMYDLSIIFFCYPFSFCIYSKVKPGRCFIVCLPGKQLFAFNFEFRRILHELAEIS